MSSPETRGGREAAAPALTRGADGWRGVITEGFSVDSAAELAFAIGGELRARFGEIPVLVTYDGRLLSPAAAAAAAQSLAAAGLAVHLGGPLPTPVATFAVRTGPYRAAVLVTASHNPFYWNGVKLKVAPGMPPGRDLESGIEARRSTGRGPAGVAPVPEKLDLSELRERYVAELLGKVDLASLRAARPELAIDGLNGVAAGWFAEVLEKAGCRLEVLGAEPDPCFGGLVPDPMRPASRLRISEEVRRRGKDAGYITDGDGDRLGVVAPNGEFVPPHDVLALLLQRCHEAEPGPGAVAVTVSTGAIVGRAARRLGRPLLETGVGFKHIAPYFQRGELLLGGGAVGDLGFRGHGCDRDPILGALILAERMARSGRSLSDLLSQLHRDVGSGCYREELFAAPPRDPDELESLGRSALRAAGLDGSRARAGRTDGLKLYLGEDAWLLLRNASTERGIRAYAETAEPPRLERLFAALADTLLA